MKSIRFLWLMACLVLWARGNAQETYPVNGVKPKDVVPVVFIHANIHIDHQTYVEDGTLVIEKGKVVEAGKDVRIPPNAVVYDVRGNHIYPAFIDLDSDYGMPKVPQPEWRRSAQPESNRKGAFGWNQAIRSDASAKLMYSANEESAKELRGIGFGTVLSHQHDGIARGTSALIGLGSDEHLNLIRPDAAAHYSLSKGSSQQDYPSSVMGSIALLRQTYYDAKWYRETQASQERNITLEAFNEIQSLPQIFETNDKWGVFRADKIGDEFGVQYIIRGGGNEYQRIEDIRKTGASFIIPIAFPDAYDVSDPHLTRSLSMTEMLHWERAPYNAAELARAGVEVAITSSGLPDRSVFFRNLRTMSEKGLSESEILKALTATPAKLIGAEKELGSLTPGKWASFFICSNAITSKDMKMHESWVQGERFVIEPYDQLLLSGEYTFSLNGTSWPMQVKGEAGKPSGEITQVRQVKTDSTMVSDTVKVAVKMQLTERLITMTLDAGPDFPSGVTRLSGTIDETASNWKGDGQLGDGAWARWSVARVPSVKASVDTAVAKTKEVVGMGDLPPVIFPFTAYGRKGYPDQETVHIMDATVWTCGPEGKIEGGDVIVSNGKIAAVGKDLPTPPGAVVIDGKGKHVSPGIIDEHSHIALASVNEGAQASSAEVEESSVIWPEDIDIYRQLSGGVTTAQLLHGSANPIGGQSAIVKLRWGANAEQMLVEGAVPFIKFALGENVTQANWSTPGDNRFPQSRLGVEQLYYDHFIRAREYGDAWKAWEQSKNKKGQTQKSAPRVDLEMKTLLQILNRERFITCHSYVQSEINMLMHVADSMGFTLNTFTHILEGYKLADKMKEHGAGASSFSDWWAYKYEVKDAIPYNGALLWEQGVTVAFNSDDAEMARRLNQEAAKAVKYGGVPEEEALKFVTLNPAKLLHLDHRIGSLEKGKDADVVLWTDNPLSIYARVEHTWVDGRRMFDVQEDKRLREEMDLERNRLVQKMMNAAKQGENTQKPSQKPRMHFHCDTLDDTGRNCIGR